MIDVGDLVGRLFGGLIFFGAIGGIVWKIRRDNVDDVTDMRSVPLLRIADARDEQMVRVAGRVVPDEGQLLTAPVSGRPCVAWELHFTASWSMGRDALIDRNGSVGFILDDGSGRAHVGFDLKVWALTAREEGRADSGDEVPATLAANRWSVHAWPNGLNR